MRHLHFRAAALLIGLAATDGAAQQIDSPYRFVDESQQAGFFVGQVFTDPGTLDLGPESGPAVGLRYGIRLSGPFSLEAAAMVLSTTRAVQDTFVVGTDGGGAREEATAQPS